MISTFESFATLARKKVGGGGFPDNPSLNTGLISYWKFDNNVTDELAATTLTLGGGAGYDTGKLNDGVLCDGVNDYIEADNIVLHYPTTGTDDAYTIAGWVWIKVLEPTGTKAIVGNRSSDSRGTYIAQVIYLSNDLRAYVANNTRADMNSGYVITSPTHICFTFTSAAGGTTKFYINHVLRGTITGDTLLPGGKFRFGAYGSGSPGLFMNVVFDNWGVWDRVLTDTERGELWNSGDGLPYN